MQRNSANANRLIACRPRLEIGLEEQLLGWPYLARSHFVARVPCRGVERVSERANAGPDETKKPAASMARQMKRSTIVERAWSP